MADEKKHRPMSTFGRLEEIMADENAVLLEFGDFTPEQGRNGFRDWHTEETGEGKTKREVRVYEPIDKSSVTFYLDGFDARTTWFEDPVSPNLKETHDHYTLSMPTAHMFVEYALPKKKGE